MTTRVWANSCTREPILSVTVWRANPRPAAVAAGMLSVSLPTERSAGRRSPASADGAAGAAPGTAAATPAVAVGTGPAPIGCGGAPASFSPISALMPN